MNRPVTKEATKKAFHFPKSADAPAPKKKSAAPAADVKVAKSPATERPAKEKPVKEKPATGKSATEKPATEKPATEKTATSQTPTAKTKAPTAQQAQATPKTRPLKSAEDAKEKRVKKDKVVRDSFTMPKSDYDKIAALKARCLAAGVSVKKSELLRAGLVMLEAAAQKRLLAAVSSVEQVKTGRPSKS